VALPYRHKFIGEIIVDGARDATVGAGSFDVVNKEFELFAQELAGGGLQGGWDGAGEGLQFGLVGVLNKVNLFDDPGAVGQDFAFLGFEVGEAVGEVGAVGGVFDGDDQVIYFAVDLAGLVGEVFEAGVGSLDLRGLAGGGGCADGLDVGEAVDVLGEFSEDGVFDGGLGDEQGGAVGAVAAAFEVAAVVVVGVVFGFGVDGFAVEGGAAMGADEEAGEDVG